ncbi:hypothetical protein V1506DRAFT_99311 [Lipomyces tetrasporus]
MLDDSLASKRQIEEYLLLQNQISPFSSEDWQHLQQVHKVLAKFNKFTLLNPGRIRICRWGRIPLPPQTVKLLISSIPGTQTLRLTCRYQKQCPLLYFRKTKYELQTSATAPGDQK